MTDAERFVDGLRTAAGSRSRIDIQEAWGVFTNLYPDDARAVDARQRLADLIRVANEAGLLTPAVSSDKLGPTPLPQFVTLATVRRAVTAAKPVPWLPELAWAADVRLDSRQLDIVDRVNRWLRDGGACRPIVPAEERSVEVFDDEKAIANFVGGATTLWQAGRLGPGLLRYENVPIPFAYTRVGSGTRLLMVENTAAFRTCTRLLAADEGHPYAVVAFGQGSWAPKTIASAVELPMPIRSVDYWGDLDVRGLAITRDVIDAAVDIGLRAQAHPFLWRLMLTQKTAGPATGPATYDRSLLKLLPGDVQPRAADVLDRRHRIPQERVGYEQLSETPRWWTP